MSSWLGLGCAVTVSVLAMACGGAVDPSAQEDGEGTTSYQAMLTCGDGAAVLAVDRDDPRRVELVVHDPDAGREVRARIVRAANDVGEIVVRGEAERPVADASQFDRFVDDSGRFDRATGSVSPSDRGAPATRIVAEVTRTGIDAVTLAFQEVTTTRTCSGTIEERFCRGGEWIENRTVTELASVRFDGCR